MDYIKIKNEKEKVGLSTIHNQTNTHTQREKVKVRRCEGRQERLN